MVTGAPPAWHTLGRGETTQDAQKNQCGTRRYLYLPAPRSNDNPSTICLSRP